MLTLETLVRGEKGNLGILATLEHPSRKVRVSVWSEGRGGKEKDKLPA
jgi:hypothetical protein